MGSALAKAQLFFILLSQLLGTQQLVGDKTPKLGFNTKAHFQGIVFLNVHLYGEGGFVRKFQVVFL